jgi:prevent-host-death family protein
MTATEARVHFGELMRRTKAGETITITRRGKPVAVTMSVRLYEELKARKAARDAAEAAARLREGGDAP